MKLPELPSEPIYDAGLGEAKYKSTDRIIEARGYEAIHTEVWVLLLLLTSNHTRGASMWNSTWHPARIVEKLLLKNAI